MSTIKVTNLSGRGGASPNLPDGANVTGVLTATSFVGSGANLTGLANTDFINAEQLTVVGVVTAATGNIGNLNITKSAAGAGATVGSFTGVTTYYGDGSNLTGVGETLAPWGYNPDVNDTGVTRSSGIGITFSKKVVAGSGTATLKIVNDGSVGATIQSWGVSSCTFSTQTLTLNPLVSNLSYDKTYQLDIPSGFITDLNETSYAGTAYTFTTTPIQRTLWSWGYRGVGQLGQNQSVSKSSPVQVPGENWRSIGRSAKTSSSYSSITTRNTATVWVMGNNDYGQLGQNQQGDSARYSSPVQVGSDINWSEHVGGGRAMYAVKTDGTLWMWGDNQYGQLAQNHIALRSSPVQIPGTTWPTSRNAMVSGDMILSIKTDGTMYGWGHNGDGELGQNNVLRYSSPVQVPGTTWKTVDSKFATVATKTDGTLWAWGSNTWGQLGLNDRNRRSSPVQVPGTTWVGAWTTQGLTTIAVKTDGTLWSWGNNSSGALGLNQTAPTRYSSPVQIPGTWSTDIDNYYAGSHTANMSVIKTDGTLWAWGQNDYGQIAQNDTNNGYSSPVQIPGTSWVSVGTMGYAVLALQSV